MQIEVVVEHSEKLTDFDDEKVPFIKATTITIIILTVVYYIYIKMPLTLGRKVREALN